MKDDVRQLQALLIEKNRKYGDSVRQPGRLSSVPIEERLLVRADDKLSRIASSQHDDAEDAWLDLAGYMVLLVAVRTGLPTRDGIELACAMLSCVEYHDLGDKPLDAFIEILPQVQGVMRDACALSIARRALDARRG
jgi:hypothetical protein